MEQFMRKDVVQAVKFKEELFKKNQLAYPMVFDKAMLSPEWMNKLAADGRYYIPLQTDVFPFSDSLPVAEGEYIVTEGEGTYYTIPEKIFENRHVKLDPALFSNT